MDEFGELGMQIRAYRLEKYAITTDLYGHRERWVDKRGQLRDSNRAKRILERYLRWRLHREHGDSVVIPQHGTLVGPLLPHLRIGMWMRVVRDVASEDRDVVEPWVNQDPPEHYILRVPVLIPRSFSAR